MNNDWYVFIEKFADGELSPEEQENIMSLYKTNPEFQVVWDEGMVQLQMVQALRPKEDLSNFMEAYIDDCKKEPKAISTFFFPLLKSVALLLLGFLSVNYLYQNKSAEIILSNNKNLYQENFLFSSVNIGDELAIIRYNDATISLRGPAKLETSLSGELTILSGKVYVIPDKNSQIKIHANHNTYKHVGTQFGVQSQAQSSELHVFEGAVKTKSQKSLNAGSALKTTLDGDTPIPLRRSAFFSPDQIRKIITNTPKYKKEKAACLQNDKVIEYFDFTTIDKASKTILGSKKRIALTLTGSTSLRPGPYVHAQAISFDSESYMSFELPKEIDDNYSIIIEFAHANFESKRTQIISEKSTRVKLHQNPEWFSAFQENDKTKESFWDYHRLALIRRGRFTIKYDFKVAPYLNKRKKPAGHQYFIGQQKKKWLNFTGNISRIIIYKGTDVKELQDLIKETQSD